MLDVAYHAYCHACCGIVTCVKHHLQRYGKPLYPVSHDLCPIRPYTMLCKALSTAEGLTEYVVTLCMYM